MSWVAFVHKDVLAEKGLKPEDITRSSQIHSITKNGVPVYKAKIFFKGIGTDEYKILDEHPEYVRIDVELR